MNWEEATLSGTLSTTTRHVPNRLRKQVLKTGSFSPTPRAASASKTAARSFCTRFSSRLLLLLLPLVALPPPAAAAALLVPPALLLLALTTDELLLLAPLCDPPIAEAINWRRLVAVAAAVPPTRPPLVCSASRAALDPVAAAADLRGLRRMLLVRRDASLGTAPRGLAPVVVEEEEGRLVVVLAGGWSSPEREVWVSLYGPTQMSRSLLHSLS